MPAISKDPNVKSLFVYCAGSLARYFQVHEGGGKAAKKGSNFFCAIVIAHIHSVPFRSFLPPSSFPSPFVPCTDADAAFSWFSALPTAVRFSGIARARPRRAAFRGDSPHRTPFAPLLDNSAAFPRPAMPQGTKKQNIVKMHWQTIR